MATNLENLATIKANLIAALTADSANPRVDYSLDGQSVTRSAWRKSLQDEIEWCDKMIASPANQGPWEIYERARA